MILKRDGEPGDEHLPSVHQTERVAHARDSALKPRSAITGDDVVPHLPCRQICIRVDIAPIAGRIVLFPSASMLHEVLPATGSFQRLALTLWVEELVSYGGDEGDDQ